MYCKEKILKPGDKINLDFCVDDKAYEGFIALFHDKNPLHTNEAYAKEKGFKGRVMHGNILNGFLSYFIGEGLPTKDVIIHSQEISYSLPVYLNDRLTFEAEVSNISEAVKIVEFKFSFRNADGKRVAKGNIQIGLT